MEKTLQTQHEVQADLQDIRQWSNVTDRLGESLDSVTSRLDRLTVEVLTFKSQLESYGNLQRALGSAFII